MLASLKKKETYEHYLETLKFALYCITHPLDGFWDLTHEKRGSIAAANTILLLTLLANLFKLQYTSFLFNQVYWPEENLLIHIASIVFPLALWVMSSAGIQKFFCGIYSAFKCSFDEFVGEKVFSPSYSSAILAPPLTSFLKKILIGG